MLSLTVKGTSINLTTEEARSLAAQLTRATIPAAVFGHAWHTGRGIFSVRVAPDGVLIPEDSSAVTKSPDFIESDC